MAKELEHVSELESRKVAEASRQTEWTQPSFMRELFLGNFRLDLDPSLSAARSRSGPSSPPSTTQLRSFLRDEVDSVEIDATGEYPEHVVDGLRKLGAFGMKIPKEYGGLGLHQRRVPEGDAAAGLASTATSSALLSAHQSIGVPQPLKLFGTRDAEEEVPAALRRGRDLRLRAHRAGASAPIRRGSRPPPRRRADGATTSSTARSSGAPTARSPSCWW